MALINDPDDLTQSSQAGAATPDGNVYINTTNKTIEIINNTLYPAGNIVPADGVTLQALYSYLKKIWKDDSTQDLIQYEFPMEAITSEQFEFINGWTLLDDTVRTYIRTGGWLERNTNGDVSRRYFCAIGLGSFVDESTQTAYYAFDGQTAKTDFTYPGEPNEAIQFFGDTAFGDVGAGDFDFTSTNCTLYIRPTPTGTEPNVEGYTFDSSSTTAIGATTLTYQAYRFPLTSVVDLDLTLEDSSITTLITNKTYTLEWYASQQNSSTFLSPDLNGGPYLFSIVIDNVAGTATPSEVYNIEKYWLRQTGDIDNGAGTEYGVLTPELTRFVGPTLETNDIDPSSTAGGVLIGSIDTNFAANFKMTDDAGTLQVFPTIASGSLNFNTNLVDDPAAKYWMFFVNAGGNTYPGANATIVNDYGGTPITGDLHYITATPAGGSATGTDGSATQGGTTLTSATNAAAWVDDDYNGKVLVVTTGSNAGYYNITDTVGTSGTLTVNPAFEATDAAMTFEIRDRNNTGAGGAAVINWDFDYTNNTQGGRTADADADVSIVSIGLNNGQYVLATGNTIGPGSGQSFSIVAALERNYNDPT